jgi:holo-[acyl-carrier protein] synthase
VTRVVGVGIDLVDVDRLAAALARRPRLATRVFTPNELDSPTAGARRAQRLAARFAAKEAAMKALGAGLGAVALRDVEVVVAEGGRPTIALHGTARDRALRLGVGSLAVSLSHTAATATAVVVAESGA